MAQTLWRGRWLIIAVVAAASVLGLLLLSSVTARYRAQTVIALDRASNYSATFDTPLTSLVVDGETVASEIELIYSRELVGQVIDDQNLLATDEYSHTEDSSSPLAGLRAALGGLLPGGDADVRVDTPPPAAAAAIDQFRDNLDIQRKGISRAIVVSFEAQDPQRAADVANALATRYIDDQQRLQRDQEGIATAQLEEKLSGVREKLRATEQAIQEQRRALGQVTPDGASKIEQRLAGLNSRLINADAESAAAQAELNQARALRNSPAAIDSIPATLTSPAVSQLRERELDLQARLSELATKYGEKHPSVRQVSNQLRQTRTSLDLEIDKIIGVLQSKANIAASRQRSIEQEMTRLEAEEAEANPAKAALVGLQREAGSLRDRIAFLEKRISEVSQVNSLANLRPFARVISAAQVPTSAAFPNKKVLIPLIALLAGLATVATLLGRFLYRHQLRNRLPVLPGFAAWVAGFPRPATTSVSGRRSDSRQAIADAALINVQKALPKNALNSIMVTALEADDDESDKGSVGWRLAQASARRGRRTLHVDLTPLDTEHGRNSKASQSTARGSKRSRRRSGSSSSGKGTQTNQWQSGAPATSLVTSRDAMAALKGLSPVSQAVQSHPTLPLDSMTAKGMRLDASMLLSGERLQQCLQDWARTYHTIIIDAPPVLNSPNAALINQACSLGLLACPLSLLMRRPEMLRRALQRLRKTDDGLTGVIVDDLDDALFDADFFAYERSEHYLARLTGNRLPAAIAGLATLDDGAAELPPHRSASAEPAAAAGTQAAAEAPARERPSVPADRLSNVVSLRRNKPRRRGEASTPVHGEAWLLQQAPEQFTIRLASPQPPGEVSQSLNYLADYLPLAWYHQGDGERRLPVLVVGLFDTLDEVRTVLGSESMSSLAEYAEPCRIASIQADITSHRLARVNTAARQQRADTSANGQTDARRGAADATAADGAGAAGTGQRRDLA